MAIQAKLFVTGEGGAHGPLVRWHRDNGWLLVLVLVLVLVVSAAGSEIAEC